MQSCRGQKPQLTLKHKNEEKCDHRDFDCGMVAGTRVFQKLLVSLEFNEHKHHIMVRGGGQKTLSEQQFAAMLVRKV